MPIARSEDLEPGRLDPAARAALTDALYAVQAAVFDGVDRESFRRYVVDSSADYTSIRVHYDETGAIVGYFASHAFVRELAGRRSLILRAEAGSLRAFRGGSTNARFGLVQAVRMARRFPGLPAYYLGCLVHPSSYVLVVRHLRPVWPSPGNEPDAALSAAMAALAEDFGLAPVGADPLVRDVHWITRDTGAERRAWARSRRPEVQYYVGRNPGYADGHGLLTLVPLSLPGLAGALGRHVATRARDEVRGLGGRLLYLPGLGAALRPAAISRRLAASPLFAGLPPERLRALSARSTLCTVAPGTALWAAGDPGTDLYVLLAGAVAIVAPTPNGEERMLDQLDAGEVFGEIAALSGEPRTAGARAVRRISLVRITRGALLDVVATDPAVRDVLYRRYSEHRARDEATDYPAFSGLTPEAVARLREDPLLARLPSEHLDALLARARPIHRPAGNVLFSAGDMADAFFLLRAGTVEVLVGDEVVARLGAGRTFGERGLNGVGEGRRTATVRTLTPCELLVVDAETFAARVMPHLPEVWSPAVPAVDVAGADTVRAALGAARDIQRGRIDGEPCVRASELLPDGRRLEAVARVERPWLRLTVDTPAADEPRVIRHGSVSVELRGDRIACVVIEGELSPADSLVERLRDGRPVRPSELERFRWTGRLGPPATGALQLLCACTGLTRGQLDAARAAGCPDAETLGAQLGAGSVCGACRPLVRRVWSGERPVAPGADEVSPDAFEAALDELRVLDGAACIAAPGSATWEITGRTVALLGGARALLIQFAYGDAMGLAQHSTFRTDPGGRLYATLQTMYGLAFSDGTSMLRLAREVYEKHQRVEGRFERRVGGFAAGTRYAATQIDPLIWVACTVVESAVFTHEALVGPLPTAEKDRLVHEGREFYRLFGIPRERFPADWTALKAYFDGVLASDKAVVGPDARMLAQAVLRSPTRLGSPLYGAWRLLTARWLPPGLAEAYGIALSPVEAAAADALISAVRLGNRMAPHRLGVSPARLDAERRLRGDPGQDPIGARVDRIIRLVLGVKRG